MEMKISPYWSVAARLVLCNPSAFFGTVTSVVRIEAISEVVASRVSESYAETFIDRKGNMSG